MKPLTNKQSSLYTITIITYHPPKLVPAKQLCTSIHSAQNASHTHSETWELNEKHASRPSRVQVSEDELLWSTTIILIKKTSIFGKKQWTQKEWRPYPPAWTPLFLQLVGQWWHVLARALITEWFIRCLLLGLSCGKYICKRSQAEEWKFNVASLPGENTFYSVP